jgi:hypothetical protein
MKIMESDEIAKYQNYGVAHLKIMNYNNSDFGKI